MRPQASQDLDESVIEDGRDNCSPLVVCQNRLRKAIETRVSQAFEEVTFDQISQQELQEVLDVCERFVTDLGYVDNTIKPCFPPEFKVMDIYVECYERTVMERINTYMDKMTDLVKTQPQSVLAFNKFVFACKDV